MITSTNAEKAPGKVNTYFDKNAQQTRSIFKNQLYFYLQATKCYTIKILKYLYSSVTNKILRKISHRIYADCL